MNKKKLLYGIRDIAQKASESFITVASRPMKSDNIETNDETTLYETDLSKIAIILQGPIYVKNDFTYETVKLYNKFYPGINIIVSTWNTEDDHYLKRFDSLECFIIKSEMPPQVKGSNISRQIKSTIEGINKAKELNCNYVCKSRTDQRFYETNIFDYMMVLLQKFPINRTLTTIQEKRIVALSCNTYKNRLYDVNDMWNFGTIFDMELYWNYQYDKSDILIEKMNSNIVSESIICANFLNKIGHNLQYTFTDSMRCYADYFVIIDKESIDLYWAKRLNEYYNKSYDKKRLCEYMFKDWICMQ